MLKKILLIENDSAFAAAISQALEQAGFDVRVTGDGKDGLDLAREWGPSAIVLCVELPGMSGYLVCQKLRKDDALHGIPLVLTSAEATADTFEKHRALKVRADAYHLKPYEPAALLETIAGLVGMPEGTAEEELVSLEEEMGLEALPPEDGAELPELDLAALPEDTGAAQGADEALALLDDAFDGLTSEAAAPARHAALDLDLGGDAPAPAEGVEVAVAEPELDAGGADPLGGLDAETEAALGALGADEALAAPVPDGTELDLDDALDEVAAGSPVDAGAELDRELAAVRPPVRGASADLLRAAGIPLLVDAPVPAARGDAVHAAASAATIDRLERELSDAQQALADARTATGADLRQARGRADEAIRRAEEAEAALSERDAELAAARAKGDAVAAQARKAEAELKALQGRLEAAERKAEDAERRAEEAERKADDAATRAEAAADDARRKADELAALEEAAARSGTLERELEEARTELVVARGEAEGSRGEIEKRTTELKRRVAELEAANAKHEERVLKAYQKIKNDEKVKDKVRKALAIASQLLEEGLPAESPAEKERRAAAATLLGRE